MEEEVPSTIISMLEKTGSSYSYSIQALQWMSSIEELYPFFDWLVNSVAEENFVTSDEMLCYNHIMKSGKLLNEDELDLKIGTYISPEPTVHIDETSIEGLQHVIETKKKVLNCLNLLKNRLRSELQKQELERYVPDVDQVLQNEVDKVQSIQQEYMKQFHILEKKIQVLSENISSLESNNKEPIYFCQNNFKSYSVSNANLELYIGIIKKKILQEKSTLNCEASIHLDSTFFVSDDDLMNRLFCWLSDAEYKNAIYKAKELAANKALKYLSDCENNIENLNFFFGSNNKIFLKNTSTIWPNNDELLTSCEFYIKDIIRGIQLNICKERFDKRKTTLKLLEELENIVKTRKLCNDSVHFLLMNEWKIIRGSVTLLEDIHNCWEYNISEFKKRMAWMNRVIIKQQMSMVTNDPIEKEFFQLVTETLTLSGDATHQDVNNSCIIKLHKSMSKHKDNVVNDFENYVSVIRNIISEVKKVDKFLFNTPTRVINFNHNIIRILKEIYELVKSVSVNDEVKDYHEYQASLQKEKNLLHMMWYEWNKNPFDVIQTILKMEEAAKIQKRRQSMIVQQELSTVQFREYSRF